MRLFNDELEPLAVHIPKVKRPRAVIAAHHPGLPPAAGLARISPGGTPWSTAQGRLCWSLQALHGGCMFGHGLRQRGAPTAAERGRREDARPDTRDAKYAGSKHGARGADWLRCDSGLLRAGPDRARPDRPSALRVESPADPG